MLTLEVLKRIAQENKIVALWGHSKFSTDHEEWVPSVESLEWVAIHVSTLQGREIESVLASTRGVQVIFDDGSVLEDDDSFVFGESEQEVLQDFLESKGLAKRPKCRRFFDEKSGGETWIVFDPNTGKVQWFDGSWLSPEEAVANFRQLIHELQDE